MRKLIWLRQRVTQAAKLWQGWSFALLAVSVLGTLLAGSALVLDGWFDALALYIVCVLLLALMLSHFAGQRMQPRLAAFAHGAGADPGGPAGLALTGAARAVMPVTAAPTD